MNYNLVITKPAEKDLADILQYISKDLSAPKAATDYRQADRTGLSV